jgi:hypothetical protein
LTKRDGLSHDEGGSEEKPPAQVEAGPAGLRVEGSEGKNYHLKQQATFESNFAKADQRFPKAEKRLDRIEQVVGQTARVVGQLASASLRFRNEIRRSQIEADRQLKTLRELGHETEDKLNALIDVVDKSIRRNGKGGGE